MMGLPYGEEITIVGRTMWTQSTSVTDEQTDGQNYDHKAVQRRASHGNNTAQNRAATLLLCAAYLCLLAVYELYCCVLECLSMSVYSKCRNICAAVTKWNFTASLCSPYNKR